MKLKTALSVLVLALSASVATAGEEPVAALENNAPTEKVPAWSARINEAAAKSAAELREAMVALINENPADAVAILDAALKARPLTNDSGLELLAAALDTVGAARLSGDQIAMLQNHAVAVGMASLPEAAETIELMSEKATARLNSRIAAQALLVRNGGGAGISGLQNGANSNSPGAGNLIDSGVIGRAPASPRPPRPTRPPRPAPPNVPNASGFIP